MMHMAKAKSYFVSEDVNTEYTTADKREAGNADKTNSTSYRMNSFTTPLSRVQVSVANPCLLLTAGPTAYATFVGTNEKPGAD